MKKISRNVIVGLIFGAAGVVALTAVPANAATTSGSSTTTVSADSTTTQVSHMKSARVWEW
jgi:MFS superfamily sulfate permease-like transporter